MKSSRKKDYISTLKAGSSQYKVFRLLSDENWHCRTCEGKKVASDQYAGGGGIQGLERGNRSGRPGLVIETKKDFCPTCKRKTTLDRWTGKMQAGNAPANLPPKLAERILTVYGHTDVIEKRKRITHELVIDHRFPMERWGKSEPNHDETMSDTKIKEKFQLLKKDSSGNHNLLKSRGCERCIKTGKRGAPLGIEFWYSGGEDWPKGVSKEGVDAENGCIGCGWYDFEVWREALNKLCISHK